MIFVTVGTQLPFERLIEAVDLWASRNRGEQVFAQIGQTLYRPAFMEVTRTISPQEYQSRLKSAEVVVGHVGMGTIISGIEHQKPLVLMPRRFDLGEHRNDHQLASAKQFGQLAGVSVVHEAEELCQAIDNSINQLNQGGAAKLQVSTGLLNRISEFVMLGCHETLNNR